MLNKIKPYSLNIRQNTNIVDTNCSNDKYVLNIYSEYSENCAIFRKTVQNRGKKQSITVNVILLYHKMLVRTTLGFSHVFGNII